MANVGVFSVPTVLNNERVAVTSKQGGSGWHVILTIKYTFYATDGSFVEAVVVGEGIDYGDKASNKAESVAHKYAMTQAFAIRTDDQAEEEPDRESHDISPPVPMPRPFEAASSAATKGLVAQVKKELDKRIAAKPWSPSEPQLTRMWAIAGASGWSKKDVKSFCAEHFGIESSKSLTKENYETLCAAMQAKLPKS